MKTITIPTWRSPYIVILNGAKYVYAAGEQVEVPDGVAAIIEADIKAHEAAQAPEQKPEAKCVKTVNGIAPDESGNVQVETGGGGEYPLVIQLSLSFHPNEEDESTGYHSVVNATPLENIESALKNGRPVVANMSGSLYGESFIQQTSTFDYSVGSVITAYFSGKTFVEIYNSVCDHNIDG